MDSVHSLTLSEHEMGLGLPIYAGDINHNINHITAEFIGLHVNWRTGEKPQVKVWME